MISFETHPGLDVAVGVAFALGALHALEPGHGKTALFARMIGKKTNFWRPAMIGIVTALSHTFSILLIAVFTHALVHLSAKIWSPNALHIALSWVSALALLATGLFLLRSAYRKKPLHSCGRHCAHHSRLAAPIKKIPKAEEPEGGWKLDALLGLGTGLMPCPTLLAAYLANLSGGRTVQGITSVLMFAAGIASALALLGWSFQFLSGYLEAKISPVFMQKWPWVQASLILACGVYFVIESAFLTLYS